MLCAQIWLKICQCVHRLKMNSIIQRSGLFMILYIQRRPRPHLLTSVIQPRRTHWMTTGMPATAIYMAHSFIIFFNKRKYLSDKNVYFNQKYSRNGISLPLIILSYHELWPLNHIVYYITSNLGHRKKTAIIWSLPYLYSLRLPPQTSDVVIYFTHIKIYPLP